MRFCFVSTQKNWGGGETLMLQLAQQLRQQGHVACWVARRHTDVHHKLSQDAGEMLYSSTSRRGSFSDWSRLRRKLRNWSPDVLVLNDTHSVTLAGWASWWQNRPAPIRLAYKHTIFPLRSALKYRWLSDQVVCVSEAAKRMVVKGGMNAQLASVVPGGCEIPSLSLQRRTSIRRELNLAPSDRLLVTVGSLLEVKGHAELLAAVAKQERTNIVLAVAGTGPLADQIKQQAESLQIADRVRMLGYRNDANDLMNASDLVVHPSHSEGLSLVLIQAKMLGKPIVATKVGGAREVLETGPDHQYGFWPSEPKDVDSLARAITEALDTLDDPPPEFADSLRISQSMTQERFDIRASASKLARLARVLRANEAQG